MMMRVKIITIGHECRREIVLGGIGERVKGEVKEE
jgi:hypothetical protein